jgi:hypothetical protein
MGLPARISHRALGGNRTDVYKVTDPKKQVGASVFNAIQWQVAGMNRTASLVTLTVAADGSRVAGAEAPNARATTVTTFSTTVTTRTVTTPHLRRQPQHKRLKYKQGLSHQLVHGNQQLK